MPSRLTPFEIMQQLVAFPTVSCDTNLPLIDWVQDYLEEHGATCYRHHHAAEPKAGLWAHAGPWEEGAVVLSGHTDVVPAAGQNWQSDPFTVTERDGRYHGRGCVDMKSFDALAVWAMAEAAGRPITTPLQLALSYDEEVGLIGADPLIRDAGAMVPKGRIAIIGEPTMMQPVTGHKSGLSFTTRVIGVPVHSSIAHTGVSAVMEAARLVQWANDLNAANMAKTPAPGDAAFDPPWTNAHVGMIHGGTAHNITAGTCEFVMSFRCVPGEPPELYEKAYLEEVARVEATMRAVHPEARIEVEKKFFAPGLAPEKDGAAEAMMRRLTGDNATHVVSYGTEAGHFQAHGYSAVVCGPGDIAQAHKPDEFITVDQFDAGHRFMQGLLDHLCEG